MDEEREIYRDAKPKRYKKVEAGGDSSARAVIPSRPRISTSSKHY